MRPLCASWLVSIAVAVVSFSAGYLVFVPKGKPRADGAAPAGTLGGMLAGRFSAASEDRVAALFAAFDEREPLRRDAAIFRAIEQLQPGDALGALGDLVALIRRVEKLPPDLWPHLAEAVLERWLALDAPGCLRWMEGAQKLAVLDPKNIGNLDPATLRRAVEVLARKQPDWAFRDAIALPREGALGEQRRVALSALFWELGQRDPSRARAFLREISDEKERAVAKSSVLLGMARGDSSAALAFARSEMDAEAIRKMLPDLAYLLYHKGGSEDPSSIRQWIEEFSDPATRPRETVWALEMAASSAAPFPYDWLTSGLEAVALLEPAEAAKVNSHWLSNISGSLFEREPERLRAWVETLSGEARVQANRALFGALAQNDAQAAFDWLATLPQDALGSPQDAANAFHAATWNAPERLSQWIAAQPPGRLRDAALAARTRALAGHNRFVEAMATYRETLAFDKEGNTAVRLALGGMKKERAATLDWFAALPPGIQQERAALTAAEAWTWSDPAAAAEWVESLPAGPLRDSAIAGYAPVAMHADPAAAAASVERIAAPTTKQSAAEKIFRVWLGENPIAARRWLRGLEGVESAWVEKTLQSAP